jgi:hypothetical protein
VSSVAVVLRTAEEFCFSVESFDEARFAESGDSFAPVSNEPSKSIESLSPILSDGVRQIRS